uniref:Uncharacterized protein n=1 Tax=Daphnia galeata TaxID=27404 RepID=A0A8J2WP38_9CRUS|nr:unnamed protein product [Daphnia galeata]
MMTFRLKTYHHLQQATKKLLYSDGGERESSNIRTAANGGEVFRKKRKVGLTGELFLTCLMERKRRRRRRRRRECRRLL